MKPLLFAMCLLVPATCLADMTIVLRDGTSTVTILIKGQKARLEYVEPTTPPRAVYEFLDLQAKRMMVVDRATGRAVTRTWDLAAETEIVNSMFANQKVDIRATGQRRMVNGFSCKEYRITVGGFVAKEVSYWVADGIDTSEFDPFRQTIDMAFVRLGPKLLTIPGMPIRTEIRIVDDPSDRTTIEVIRLSRAPLPDSLFVVPAR